MGPSQGDTQASPQQKKGPALSVVKSSNHPPPPAPGGGPPYTHPLPPSPPWTARGWVGVRCAFWRQPLAACTPSCHLEHSFWNFPYVFPIIFSLSRGSHQSLNSKGRGREWSVPFGLSVHLRANPGSRRQRSGPQVLAPEAQVSDPRESRPLLLLALASRGSVASSLRRPASLLPGQ